MKINKSYILASALVATSAVAPAANVSVADAASKTITVTRRVNFRTGPSMDYYAMRKLHRGYKLTYLGKGGKKNRWIKVKYQGRVGYVYNTYVKGDEKYKAKTSDSSSSSVVSLAKSKLGKPYVWGAQGPNSFDCSGFTYYVMKNKGKSIPRTSSSQSRYGTYVSRSNLRAGDLVFFDTSGSNNGNVSHAGIYIGSGNFIHASSSKGRVVISNMSSGHYYRAFVNGRRV